MQKNTANTTFSCGMLQNAGFGTIPCGGGGGGGSEPRTGIIYGLGFSPGAISYNPFFSGGFGDYKPYLSRLFLRFSGTKDLTSN